MRKDWDKVLDIASGVNLVASLTALLYVVANKEKSKDLLLELNVMTDKIKSLNEEVNEKSRKIRDTIVQLESTVSDMQNSVDTYIKNTVGDAITDEANSVKEGLLERMLVSENEDENENENEK